MSQYDPHDDLPPRRDGFDARNEWRDRGRRLVRWLASRSGETWAFFGVGFLIGALLF